MLSTSTSPTFDTGVSAHQIPKSLLLQYQHIPNFDTESFCSPNSQILVAVQYPVQGSFKLACGSASYILCKGSHKKISPPFISNTDQHDFITAVGEFTPQGLSSG